MIHSSIESLVSESQQVDQTQKTNLEESSAATSEEGVSNSSIFSNLSDLMPKWDAHIAIKMQNINYKFGRKKLIFSII